MAHFSFIWKDVFDLENTETLPYFLGIGAKLEVGSKMGYLLTSGRDAHHSRLLTAEKRQPGWCRWGQVHVPNLCASLCHRRREWQEDKEICGLSLKHSPDRVHTLLRNQFTTCVCSTCAQVYSCQHKCIKRLGRDIQEVGCCRGGNLEAMGQGQEGDLISP